MPDATANPAEVIAHLYKLAAQLNEPKFIEEAKKLERTSGLSTLTEETLRRFITVDPDCLALKERVRKLVSVEEPVLIQGETGTGKELLATALHGGRKGQFIAVNCAGMPHELIESELFGYAPGAFTGSLAKGTPGLIRSAQEGTLFLDEIGDLPLAAQAKLLRVLQDKKVRPVGGLEIIPVDVRFVAATHHNLETCVEEGVFRRDLYARLAAFKLYIKPLRDRKGDAKLILDNFDRNKTFPWSRVSMLDWKLKNNVRDVEAIYKRWHVLGDLPSQV